MIARMDMNMSTKKYLHLLAASVLLLLPACEQKPNVNQQDGIKDAIGARPYEGARDAAEDASDTVKEAGRDIKDAVDGK
jgi:outer membrane biogenesis lipoprotein LolB